MRYYPAFMDIQERLCLVVGGGAAALAKVRLLRRAGAQVCVVAPRAIAELHALGGAGKIELSLRKFRQGDVLGRALVHAASGIARVDEAVAGAASAANVPVNVVDRAALSSFIMPAIVDRGPMVIGISSGGASPLLARRVRAEIEMLLPDGLGKLAHFAHKFRSAVRATFGDFETRRRFWENFFDSPLAEAVLRGKDQHARAGMLALVNRAQPPLVGEIVALDIDPIDADLLTLRDARRIARADVLIYGDAISPAILDHARRDAARIDAPREDGELKILAAAHLRAGKRVVHLRARRQAKQVALGAV